METSTPYRPRVSRETRLLLTAGAIAVAALWLLARVRFPERPISANPVPSVLSQLANGSRYGDLASEIADVRSRLGSALLTLDALPSAGGGAGLSRTAAIVLRDGLALTWLTPPAVAATQRDRAIVASDAASGLTLVRWPTATGTAPLVPWTPRQFQRPHYFYATEASAAGVSLRPAFVGSLDPVDTPLWTTPMWTVPPDADVAAGSFLFTNSAELAGVVMAYRGGLAIVPGGTVLAEADRLLAAPPGNPGAIAVEVQELTAALAAATGASAGVVVAWVRPDTPEAKLLAIGDVIETIDGHALSSRQQWDVPVARLSAGQTLVLRVRHRGDTRDVTLMANANPAQPNSELPGVALRSRTGIGAEVIRIDRGSAAERAGLIVGDMITLSGSVGAPTSAQILRAFAGRKPGDQLMLAVTRGTNHFMTTLER